MFDSTDAMIDLNAGDRPGRRRAIPRLDPGATPMLAFLQTVALHARPRLEGPVRDEDRPAVVAAIRRADALLSDDRFAEAEALVDELSRRE